MTDGGWAAGAGRPAVRPGGKVVGGGAPAPSGGDVRILDEATDDVVGGGRAGASDTEVGRQGVGSAAGVETQGVGSAAGVGRRRAVSHADSGTRGAPPEIHDGDSTPTGHHPGRAPRIGSPHAEQASTSGSPAPAWSVHDLVFRYRGADHPTLDHVSLEIPAGRCTAVLGPNGAGKSTLLQLLLGTLRPDAGQVLFEGRPAADWSRRDFARAVGVVPQLERTVFPLTVRELVAMGRYPYLGAWRREGAADRAAIATALESCDLGSLANRPLRTLSGGERQRARVARALAQEPRALALDEPTVSLDIRHEMAIFELLPAMCAAGATVVVVTHNLNLAARYAHRLVLLARGRLVAEGPPREVLTRATVEGVYGWPVTITSNPGPGADAGAPQVVPLGFRN